MSRPDPIALAAALACLGVAIPAVADDAGWLPDHPLRWFVAWAVVLAGLILAAGALWERRRHD